MIIKRVVSDMISSNMYIVIEGTGAIVVDPCRNIEMPDGVIPELIFLTHEHYDHISGVNAWKEKYNTKVICSAECNSRIQSKTKNMARYFVAFCEIQTGLDDTPPSDFDPDYECSADEEISEDVEFTWRGHLIRFILLPGHSAGSSGILIDNCLFSGDSIFENQDTVLNFPGGSKTAWEDISLPKILALPPDIIVYPGHFDSFRLEKWSPYKEVKNGIFY